MKKIIKLVVVSSIIISLIVYGKSIFGLSGANDSIKTKVQLVKEIRLYSKVGCNI